MLPKTFTIVLSFLASFFFLTQKGTSAEKLTVSQVIRSTMHNYPKLEEQYQKYKQAQAEVLSSKGVFDPSLTAESRLVVGSYYDNQFLDVSVKQKVPLWGIEVFSGWRRGQGLFPVYDEILATNNAGEIYGGLKVALLRDGITDKERTNIEVAKLVSEEESLENTSQQILFTYQARLHYWKWFIEGHKLQVYKELLEIAKFRQSAIGELVSLGIKPEMDRWDNDRLIAKREALLVESEQNFQQAALKLSLFYRDKEGKPLVPKAETLPSLNFITREVEQNRVFSLSTEDLSLILKNHPRLKIDQLKINQVEKKLRLAKNQVLPGLDLGVRLSNDLGDDGPPSVNNEELKVGLSFEMPLLNREAREQKKIVALEAERLRVSYNFLVEKIKTNIEDAIQQSTRSRERISLDKRQWILAQKVQQSEEIKFYLGYSDLLDVNLREEFTTSSKIAYLEALLNHQIALANYDLSIARPPQFI